MEQLASGGAEAVTASTSATKGEAERSQWSVDQSISGNQWKNNCRYFCLLSISWGWRIFLILSFSRFSHTLSDNTLNSSLLTSHTQEEACDCCCLKHTAVVVVQNVFCRDECIERLMRAAWIDCWIDCNRVGNRWNQKDLSCPKKNRVGDSSVCRIQQFAGNRRQSVGIRVRIQSQESAAAAAGLTVWCQISILSCKILVQLVFAQSLQTATATTTLSQLFLKRRRGAQSLWSHS